MCCSNCKYFLCHINCCQKSVAILLTCSTSAIAGPVSAVYDVLFVLCFSESEDSFSNKCVNMNHLVFIYQQPHVIIGAT